MRLVLIERGSPSSRERLSSWILLRWAGIFRISLEAVPREWNLSWHCDIKAHFAEGDKP